MIMASERPMLLVVDDTPANIDVLSEVLRPYYRVKAALNGERALAIANTTPRPDMILLDVMMPEMDGLETCRRLKANPATTTIPVIFVTAMSNEQDEERGLLIGAADYITKPISPPVVLARVKTHLALHQQNVELERKVRERTEELVDTRIEIIRRLGRASEFRDNETGLHIIRMSHYSRLIAMALGANDSWVDTVFNAAPMHDIGKIGIPDGVLLKPGKLTEEEWLVMKTHPEIGAEIIGEHSSEILRMSREIALAHHEQWDGAGYPRGLAGAEIPLSARIISVADVFDALTTERPYKKAWTVDAAIEHIVAVSGQKFDPKLVDVFLKILPEILKIRDLYEEKSNNMIGRARA
jgi:putative two-component system response regulator